MDQCPPTRPTLGWVLQHNSNRQVNRGWRIVLRNLLCIKLLYIAAGAALADGLSDQRRADLVYLLHQDCGSCHGMTLKGGLGPSLLPEALQGKPASYLRHVISKGVPDKAMPPWENILEPQEIDFLVTYLQQGPAP